MFLPTFLIVLYLVFNLLQIIFPSWYLELTPSNFRDNMFSSLKLSVVQNGLALFLCLLVYPKENKTKILFLLMVAELSLFILSQLFYYYLISDKSNDLLSVIKYPKIYIWSISGTVIGLLIAYFLVRELYAKRYSLED
jgi:hypothetical protein